MTRPREGINAIASAKSRFVRLALTVALLPTLIIILFGLITIQQTNAQLTRTLDQNIDSEIAALAETAARSGLPAAVQSIAQRSAMQPSGDTGLRYRLVDARANRLTVPWPDAFSPLTDMSEDKPYREVSGYRARTTVIASGASLTVAVSTAARDTLVAKLRRLLFICALAALALGLLLGWATSQRVATRFRRVNQTLDKAANGDLSARLEEDPYGDEISGLSLRVNAMLTRAQKLVLSRKWIADQVAHEVRTPLTRLSTHLEDLEVDGAADQRLSKLRSEISRCVELLDGLLDVSTLEAQKGDRSGFAPLNLTKSVMDMADFYEALAQDQNIRFKTPDANPIMIDGDNAQIQRMIANLISNALKFTPNSGTVKIDVSAAPPTLTISDTGPGISDDFREQIFQPFYRKVDVTSVDGHGLGLALVKAITERHGATIAVSDRSDGQSGAIFTVTFPAPKAR